jgi:L-lactate dehydrogenase complex protein LldG
MLGLIFKFRWRLIVYRIENPARFRVQCASFSMRNDLRPIFERVFTGLRGHVHHAATWDDAARVLLSICAQRNATCFAVSQLPAPLVDALNGPARPQSLTILNDPYASADLPGAIDRAQVGSTGIEFAIAETGTLVEISRNDATRLVSGLPRTHIGVVSGRQIVPSLGDASARLRRYFTENDRDCVASFLSGPSRTGDIELRLTLGVHGPEDVHALLLDPALDPEAE